MSATKEDNKEIQQLISKLIASDNKKVLEGLKESRKKGLPEIVPLIIDILVDTENETIYQEASNILFDLKLQESTEFIIQALKSPKTLGHKNVLVSALWQSNLDASDYMKDLVEVATTNDYLTALECLTVIENFEGPFQTDELEESISLLHDHEEKEEDKKELLLNIEDILENFKLV